MKHTGSVVTKLSSCSTQLIMNFSVLIGMNMPIIVGVFIFISRKIFKQRTSQKFEIQSNLSGSNRFGTMEICSRYV